MTTTTEPSYSARRLIADGYIDAISARTHLAKIMATECVSFYRLSLHIGWPSMSLLRLADGRSRLVHPDLERRLLAVDPDSLYTLYPRPEPPAATADEDVLAQVLLDAPVSIETKDKPAYVRALYRDHGWGKTRISRALGISGTKINKALNG